MFSLLFSNKSNIEKQGFDFHVDSAYDLEHLRSTNLYLNNVTTFYRYKICLLIRPKPSFY